MRFDASIATQLSVRRTLGLDPRMIRFSVVKLGSKLEEVKDIVGTEKWNDKKEKDWVSAFGVGENAAFRRAFGRP